MTDGLYEDVFRVTSARLTATDLDLPDGSVPAVIVKFYGKFLLDDLPGTQELFMERSLAERILARISTLPPDGMVVVADGVEGDANVTNVTNVTNVNDGDGR